MRRSFSCCWSRSLSLAAAAGRRPTGSVTFFRLRERSIMGLLCVDSTEMLSREARAETSSVGSTVIRSFATRHKFAVPSVPSRHNIFKTALTRRSSSRISLPFCLRSMVWYNSVMPQRVRRSPLFRQKEKVILLSSSNWTTWMMRLLESPMERRAGAALDPSEDPTAGR